ADVILFRDFAAKARRHQIVGLREIVVLERAAVLVEGLRRACGGATRTQQGKDQDTHEQVIANASSHRHCALEDDPRRSSGSLRACRGLPPRAPPRAPTSPCRDWTDRTPARRRTTMTQCRAGAS